MKNNIAIIDMGTNTFHLMVAELDDLDYHIIHRERVAVKIGMGGINDGIIIEEGMTRALNALHYFRSILDKFSIKKTLAFGTSALRNAKNGQDIISRIKNETGIDAKIISGDEEATYIYKGVRAAMNLGIEKSLIVDIGGGSVEFIIGNEKEIYWKQSFEIGAQRLLEKFQKHDPILSDEIVALYEYFKKSLQPLLKSIDEYQPKILVGSSGTFDTLSEIYCLKNSIEWQDRPETPLTIESFYKIFEEFKNKNRDERLQIPGMIEMRVDMIVVASCLIDFLLANIALKGIRVSSYSLKEGVLASLIKNYPDF